MCPSCQQYDTLIADDEEDPRLVFEAPADERPAKQATKIVLRNVRRVPTGSAAWDIVLGGGLVLPSAVLVYGTRGAGKSTKALAIACHVSKRLRTPVLYGSAEMPAEHVRLYAERLGLTKGDLSRLWIQESNDAADMLADIERLKPKLVVWDSIQRFQWEGGIGETELRNVVHHAIDANKRSKGVVLLLSQVSNEDVFLGPNGIGHDVDAMVRLVRRDDGQIEVSCPDKNRFAETPLSATETLIATAAPRPSARLRKDVEALREELTIGPDERLLE